MEPRIESPGWRRVDALVALLLAGLTLLAFRGVLEPQESWISHDMVGGLMRTAATARALEEGQWLPRWSRDLYGGYGYPLLYFYPPLFSWLAALLVWAGSGTMAAVKAVGALTLWLSGWLAFRTALRMGDRPTALLAGAAWMLFPYRLAVLFLRAAWAESLALSLLPLLILGGLELDAGRRRAGVAYLTAGTALVIAAHNAVWVMIAPLLAFWLALLLWGRRREGGLAAGALLAGMLVASPYWLPALAHHRLVSIQRLLTSARVDYRRHFVDLEALWSPHWRFGGPGYLLLAMLPLALWAVLRLRRRRDPSWRGLTAALICNLLALTAMLPFARPLWDRLPLLPYVGYPWRFLGPLGLFAMLLLPTTLTALVADPRHRAVLAGGLVATVLIPQAALHSRPTPRQQSEHSLGRESCIRSGTTTVAADEYTPIWVKRDPRKFLGPRRELLEPTPFLAGAVVDVDHGHRIRLVIEARQPGRLVIRSVDFPGWTARLDGVPVRIHRHPPHGFQAVDVPGGTHELELRFGWSAPSQRLALGMALLGAVLLAALTGRVRPA